MSGDSGRSWLNYALGALCLGALVAAILVVGPAADSSTTTRRTATALLGVVQSTVSGSGNLEPDSQLDLGFKAAGTIERVYVKQGEYVTEGKLLASLDPVPAEVTLEQARAALQTAEASLSREEETKGEASASTGAGASSSGQAEGKGHAAAIASTAAAASSTLSAATREANLASARAAVKSDQLTVRSDEEALAGTKLYAPQNGTIVSLLGQVGEIVSATGTSRASASGSGSSGSGGSTGAGRGSSGAGGSSGSSGAGAGGSGGGSNSESGSGDSSTFAVLSDLSSMKLVAILSESEIHQVKVGQIATVTVEALEGRTQEGTGKLAAHVSEVATLSTSSNGVVGYDVTFQLDQTTAGLKPGMSANAEVVVEQEQGISVPSSAISGGAVTVVRGGQDLRQSVTTGLAGNSSTVVTSGLHAGETVLLPQASSSSGASSLTTLLRSRLGGGGAGGGLGGGGGAFIGGGGGGGPVFRVSGG